MDGEIQRDLGKHEAQIDALERDIHLMRAEMKSISDQLATINTTLSEAKGGWKTLMFISGASAAVGGLLVKLLAWLPILPR